jgi:hypothetical protein
MPSEQACESTVQWLVDGVLSDARGDMVNRLEVPPQDRFWLGLLSPESAVVASPLGDRAERMDPCAMGVRLCPQSDGQIAFTAVISAVAWNRSPTATAPEWVKSQRCSETIEISTETTASYSLAQLSADLDSESGRDLRMRLDVDVQAEVRGGRSVAITVVNETRHDIDGDPTLYEVCLEISGLSTKPFQLEALPDSFRYDRRVPAYGINCSVDEVAPGQFRTVEAAVASRHRPRYWTAPTPPPDLAFNALADDPVSPLRLLVEAHARWGDDTWSQAHLDSLANEHGWSDAMREEARSASEQFQVEARRLNDGLELLSTNDRLRRAFSLMNRAMAHSTRGRFPGWRPFQIGFILASLASITDDHPDRKVADILWFATGGGKTETYLGLLVTALFFDRLNGKATGVTAWSRFPLRLLSLQQTQRFANAICSAELVRRDERIEGDPFSLGFFVGQSSTPNSIKDDPGPDDPNPVDPTMPSRYKLLRFCPFCDAAVEMAFDRRSWRLEHRCTSRECPWPEDGLPVYIVDYEIYRFLPSVIVGTLDKVALASMQVAMGGILGAPTGVCSLPGHGYTYAARSSRPSGCLVPGCTGTALTLPMQDHLYPPSIRLQDELHLLRDSLGAIDAHYESLLDHLAEACGAEPPKIVASSATLTGYKAQADAIYRREARVFPLQGSSIDSSFWTETGDSLLRRYVALAPRGVTQEYAADRILTTLQGMIRRLAASPSDVAREIGIDAAEADAVISLFGTDVIYGNTIRDLEASARSLESEQVPVQGALNTASLTGHTPFPEVAEILERLEEPEADFEDRLHVITASAMMSHGVDIDRLNVMVMLGVPLTTAEFMQATARIGRRWPGCVFVLHKMALERDASIFRSFGHFVTQGDRFVEPVPVTRKSLRVLERTLPGLVQARIHHHHERTSGQRISMAKSLRQYARNGGMTESAETAALLGMLQINATNDPEAVAYVEDWVRSFFQNINDPDPDAKWMSDLFPGQPPMRSLRDVELPAPVQD